MDVVVVTRLCFLIFSGFLNFGGGRVRFLSLGVVVGASVVVVVVILFL